MMIRIIFFNGLAPGFELGPSDGVGHRFPPMAKARVSLPITECNNKKRRRRSQPAVRFPDPAIENLRGLSIYKQKF